MKGAVARLIVDDIKQYVAGQDGSPEFAFTYYVLYLYILFLQPIFICFAQD